jgi:hypothetical protein
MTCLEWKQIIQCHFLMLRQSQVVDPHNLCRGPAFVGTRCYSRTILMSLETRRHDESKLLHKLSIVFLYLFENRTIRNV